MVLRTPLPSGGVVASGSEGGPTRRGESGQEPQAAEQHRQAAEVHRQATEVAQATTQRAAESAEFARAKYGVTVVLAGMGGTLVAFGLALLAFDKASAVSAALAPITGVIGTLVGAYFGVQVGASGKSESEAARTKAENDAKKLAAVAPPEAGLAALGVRLPER
jgi:hypothetical protein